MFFRVKIQLLHVTSHCVSSPMCINAANASGASTAATAEGCVVWFVDFPESWIWTKDGGFCISNHRGKFFRMVRVWNEMQKMLLNWCLTRTVTRLMKKIGSFFQVFEHVFRSRAHVAMQKNTRDFMLSRCKNRVQCSTKVVSTWNMDS